MADAQSPQVVVREVDLSTVAGTASSAIAAIVGGAVKGPVNTPTFVSDPDQFVDIFGEPSADSFLGLTAVNYLRYGNQLWVTRIASEDGDNPIQSATTDTAAVISSSSIASFAFTETLELQFDNDNVAVINFTPTNSANITAVASTINAVLGTFEPKLGVATVVGTDQISITSQSNDGPLSRVVVQSVTAVGTTALQDAFQGLDATGEKTVLTETALTAASIESAISTTVDTSVVYANAVGDVLAGTANVSKQGQDAYGIFSVSSNSFTEGSYNTGSVSFGAVLPLAAETITINGVALAYGTELAVPATAADAASDLADYINTNVSITSGIPTIGVTAIASGNSVALTQVDPVSATTVALATTVGDVTLSGATTAGGSDGDVVEITVPALVPANLEDTVSYYFLAGADFVASGSSTVTEIASSLASVINNRDSYFPLDANSDYALASTNNSNQVTVTTASGVYEEGNTIIADITGAGSLTSVDLGGSGELQHGFAARATYSFGTITIDGTVYNINFDTVSSSIIPSKHEATLAQVAAAINDIVGADVATVSGSNELVVSSPTAGAEGSILAVASSNSTAGLDPFETAPTVTAGSGDNHLVFKVDDTHEVDVYFTQSATLSLTDLATEINTAAEAVDSSLSSVAVVGAGSQTVVITTPTAGTLAEFGGALQITNGLGSFFTAGSIVEGAGSKIGSTTITATSAGSWANGTVKVTFQAEDETFYLANSSRVDVYFEGSVVETYREVLVDPASDNYIEKLINGASEYIVVDFDDDALDLDPDTLSSSVRFVNSTSIIGSNPPYALSGGGDGIDGISDAEVIGVPQDVTTGEPTGLQVYADKEKVLINLLAAPGFSSQAVGNALVTIGEGREDVLVVPDPPMGLTPEQVTDWHNGLGYGRTVALNSSYAAIFGSWIPQFDPYNNTTAIVPPSSHLLAQYAFSDRQGEPWFATAGLNRGRLTIAEGVLNPPSLGQRELMYGNGNAVNPIVNFVQEGVVVWGQKTTLRQNSALNRVNVRRLLNYAKTVTEAAAKTLVFEPNDPITSQRLVNIVNPLLYSIAVRRGITDFKVVDKTTDNDRNQNRIVLYVFITPTTTAEVIDIPFVITEQGGSFNL